MENYPEIYNSKIKGLPSDPEMREAWKPYVIGDLNEKANAGLQPGRYELEKSEDDLRTIKLAIDIVKEDLKELGFANFDIPIERIHLVSRMNLQGSRAEATSEYINIAPSFNEIERLNQFYNLVHELWHYASINYYDASGFIETANQYWQEMNAQGFSMTELQKVRSTRVGYNTIKNSRVPGQRPANLFDGLNEAITERSTIDSLEKHADKIKREFNLTNEFYDQSVLRFINSFNESDGSYPLQRKVLDSIINGVSVRYKENKVMTWRRLKDGFISGNMMHLKRIERTFGRGSLSLLSLMGGSNTREPNYILNRYVELFDNPSPQDRRNIIQEIINAKSNLSGIGRSLRRIPRAA